MRGPQGIRAATGLGLLLLSGCMSPPEVVAVGSDSFLATASARSGLSSGQAIIRAIETAHGYCAQAGKGLSIQRQNTSVVDGFGTASVWFRCSATDQDQVAG